MDTIRRLTPLAQRARSAALSLAGFASLTAAAWTAFGLGAGLAAGGLSCFALEYLTGDEQQGARR